MAQQEDIFVVSLKGIPLSREAKKRIESEIRRAVFSEVAKLDWDGINVNSSIDPNKFDKILEKLGRGAGIAGMEIFAG